MNILVCVSNDNPDFFLQQPVEALYTGTLLKQQGHTVTLLDFRTDIPDAKTLSRCRHV